MTDPEGAQVVALRRYRPKPSTHPLVARWRRQAEDIYMPAEARSARRECARELAEWLEGQT